MKPVPLITHPIHELLLKRWSPRAFSSRTISPQEIDRLFEAARWAPSCFNEQPWEFVYAEKSDAESFGKLAGCLVDRNRAWAEKAPLLIVTVSHMSFERNGKPNPYAWHDVGLAMGNFTVQANSMGMFVHQMAGFSREKAREACGIPEGYEPVAMVAVGYLGDPGELPSDLAAMEIEPQVRRESTAFVHKGHWRKA